MALQANQNLWVFVFLRMYSPWVAYLLAADIVLGLPPSRLRRLTQPVKSPPNWLSTSRLLCLACL
jgi:hypothetical protein